MLSGRRLWLSIATRHVAKSAKREALVHGLEALGQGSHGLGPRGYHPDQPGSRAPIMRPPPWCN